MNVDCVDTYLEQLLDVSAPAVLVAPEDQPTPEPEPARPEAPAEPVGEPAPEPVPDEPVPEPESTLSGPAPEPEPAPAPVPAPASAERTPPASLYPLPGFAPESHPPEPRPPAVPKTRWLRLWLRSDSYAVELLSVQEVVRPLPLIRLRGTSSSMLGVMNLRGRVVPVIDLALWFGHEALEPDAQSRVIVAESKGELLGVLVTRVEDVVGLSDEQIEAAPEATPAIAGIARTSTVPTVLVKASALFG